MRHVADGGGHVLLYLDPIVTVTHGRYHALLFEDSACGPAVSAWPGLPPTPFGPIAEFRPGSVLSAKLACVLEATVAENPWIARAPGEEPVDSTGARRSSTRRSAPRCRVQVSPLVSRVTAAATATSPITSTSTQRRRSRSTVIN